MARLPRRHPPPATRLLPAWLPAGAGLLPLGWWGAFLLNFVAVDFLYYWQHRWFHRMRPLWQLHRCHHSARRVDIWVTSRNTLVMHFLFVHFLFNPLLGYLVTRPDAFFAGAMLTASLDLFRHTDLDFSRIPGSSVLSRWLGTVLILPSTHRLSDHYAKSSDRASAPIPSAVSWFHFMDESHHFNTSTQATAKCASWPATASSAT